MSLELPSDPEELRRFLANLSPKARQELEARYLDRVNPDRKIWFCQRGRSCDGKPHDGAPYKHARGSQWPPAGKDWMFWLISAGRGGGKSRSGAEYIRHASRKYRWIALIAPTNAAARNVMIEGESGILAACDNAKEQVNWEPSKKRLTFSSGAQAFAYSAEEPDRLRGPQHDLFWGDEPAHWGNGLQETWDNLMFGLRLGLRPHGVLTTTPLPHKWMKDIAADPRTVLVNFSTYANIDNLAPSFADEILKRYEGTFLGRQEIHGEIVDARVGAFWLPDSFIYVDVDSRAFDRVVVGVDPAGSAGKKSDETGIIVVGILDGAIYVLDDFTGKFSPAGWAAQVQRAYEKWDADAVVVERNYGGDMVKQTLKDAGFEGRVKEARATSGKEVRVEPLVGKYERGEVFHASGGRLQKLEGEQVSWVPGESKSPNRIDALVWAATDLSGRGGPLRTSDPSKLRPINPGNASLLSPRRRGSRGLFDRRSA